MTPAMAAGLVTSPWHVEDIVALVEKAQADAASKTRGPYKPRVKKHISNRPATHSESYLRLEGAFQTKRYDKRRYIHDNRNWTEFGCLKYWRHIIIRYENCPRVILAAITLAAIVICSI